MDNLNKFNGMVAESLRDDVIRTLLYYEIFDYPLSLNELFLLLPHNSLTQKTLEQSVQSLAERGELRVAHGFIQRSIVARRLDEIRGEREQRAIRRMRIARFMAQLIRRFPFVRGVFLSGDLSKGVASKDSDIDYMIVTAPGRLWICRALLVLFKKTFLLNSRKYFCLNYYIDTESLTLEDRTYYTATEIAHLKPLANHALFLRYIEANRWIRDYFPNFVVSCLACGPSGERRSLLQRVLELPFRGRWADSLDRRLMTAMQRIWKERYPEFSDSTREKIFHCSLHESRAYVGNFSERILALYEAKLKEYSPA